MRLTMVACLVLLTGCAAGGPRPDAPALGMRAPVPGGVPVSISFDEGGGQHSAGTTESGDIAVYLTFPDEDRWVPGDFDIHYTVIEGGQPDDWKKVLSNPPSCIYSTSGNKCFFRLYTAGDLPRDVKVRIWATRTDPPFNSDKQGTLTITR